jgi:hypothetical protein
MARRRNSRKKTTKRRKKTGINLVNTAELYMQTAVLTNGLMGTNPLTALTGLEYGSNVFGSGRSQVYGNTQLGYFPSSSTVTLPELLGLDKASQTYKGSSQLQGFTSSAVDVPFGQGIQTLKDNARANAVQMMVQSIGVRAGFAIGKKLFSKQRSFINNKVLKPLNMRSMVVV